jgi:hypothetical protein
MSSSHLQMQNETKCEICSMHEMPFFRARVFLVALLAWKSGPSLSTGVPNVEPNLIYGHGAH